MLLDCCSQNIHKLFTILLQILRKLETKQHNKRPHTVRGGVNRKEVAMDKKHKAP